MTSMICEPAARWSARSALSRALCDSASAGAAIAKAHATVKALARESRCGRRRRVMTGSNDANDGSSLRLTINAGHVASRRASVPDRFDQHALRSARGPNGLEPPIPNPVVDSPPRHAQQLRGVVERHAATDTWLRAVFRCTVAGIHGDCSHIRKAQLVPRLDGLVSLSA